jgi:hypothetical protein
VLRVEVRTLVTVVVVLIGEGTARAHAEVTIEAGYLLSTVGRLMLRLLKAPAWGAVYVEVTIVV